jgi:hypothetical protein
MIESATASQSITMVTMMPPSYSSSDSSNKVNTNDPPESASSSSAMAMAMATLMASSGMASAESSAEQRKVARPANSNNSDNDDVNEIEIDSTISVVQQRQAAAVQLQLPQLISATVSKQRDQPAGLTLIANNGVIISAISPSSPFHADNNVEKIDDQGDGGNGNDINTNKNNNNNFVHTPSLQINDKILLINSHRVKNPHRAVQLIKGARSGQLTIVASRKQSRNGDVGEGGGLREQGMAYVLARVDSNPFVIRNDDLHDEAAVVIGEKKPLSLSLSSSSPLSQPYSTRKNGDTVYGLQFSSLSLPSSAGTTTKTNMAPLTRISYKSNTIGPFVNTDLKLGDVVLSVDGNVVHSVSDAERLILGRSDSTSGLLEAGIHDSSSKRSSGSTTRVVILLVYSLWDLRKQVIEKALNMDIAAGDSADHSKQEGSEGGTALAGQHLWQVSYSYELQTKNDDREQKEFILLRIQNTTVTFQLDFADDGTCSCRDHYQSLLSLDSMEEQQRQSREIKNAIMTKRNESINSDFDDSESIESDGNRSTYSRDDALAALELLYQIHVVPVIDALNCHTRKQLRLLAEAIAAACPKPSLSSLIRRTDDIVSSKRMIDRVKETIVDLELPTTATSVAIVPVTNYGDAMDNSDERLALEQSPLSQPREITSRLTPKDIPPQQKKEDLNTSGGNVEDAMTVAKPQKEQWMAYIRNQSNPEVSLFSAHSSEHVSRLSTNGEDRRSPKHVPRRHSVETHSTNMPTASSIPRFSRRQTVEATPPARIRRQIMDEEGHDGNSPELNPNRVIDKPFTVIEVNNNSNHTVHHNQRRPQTKIQRRPSIVPEFNLHYASFRSALSALSDSEDDSSGSDTTTADSDDSISTSDSESSENDEYSEQRDRSQARRGENQQRSRSPNTSQLILYSPRVQEEEFKEVGQSACIAHFPTNGPPLKRHLKMRNGDIRKIYKVLHQVVGTGSFGTVRTCVHRSTRQRYVVKSIMINGNMKNATLLKDEIALVQRVHHRNVVSVRDVIQDRRFIHIVMEKCHGGDLFDKIVNGGVRLSEDRACAILNELLDAVAYLHERNIVHRDLKVRFNL